MYYLRARYYDQTTSRFNRLDPFDCATLCSGQECEKVKRKNVAHNAKLKETIESNMGEFAKVLS
jgi:hypothetical protein